MGCCYGCMTVTVIERCAPMLKTYQNPLVLNRQSADKPSKLVVLINPSTAEIQEVSDKYHIQTEILNFGIAHRARPRIQMIDNTNIIINHLPLLNNKTADIPFGTTPFSIVEKDGVMICISRNDHSIFHEIAAEYEQTMTKDKTLGYFIFSLLEKVADQFIFSIQNVNEKVLLIENELKESIKNHQVFLLLKNNKSLNLFSSSLKANLAVLQQLRHTRTINQVDDFNDILDDIIVETEQAQMMAEINNINLSNLMDAYSAAIENNLSLLVQYLSIFVILAAIPMGIAGIYGMNTPLPFQDESYALAVLGAIAVGIAVLLVVIFKKRQII